MKQLLIVNKSKALNTQISTVNDLSGLQEGAITFFELGASTYLAAAPTKNFAIALGVGHNSAPFVIPEVDLDTLEITKTVPSLGKAFAVSFTMPTTVKGDEYGILFSKKGVVANERSNFYVSIVAGSTTAATEANALRKAINDKKSDMFPFTATGSGATVTVTCDIVGDMWAAKLVDGLAGTAWASNYPVEAQKTVGDKAFITELASQCAAGKGFNYVDGDGKEIYPGYPEAVEDLVVNASGTGGASTEGYVVFNLHFATGRKAGKQMDERVWQYVHIAVPITNASYSTISTILPEGKFSENLVSRVVALENA